MWPDKCVSTGNASLTITVENKAKSPRQEKSKTLEKIKTTTSIKNNHKHQSSKQHLNKKNDPNDNLKVCIAQRVSDIFCRTENGEEMGSSANQAINKTSKLNDVSLTAFVQKCADPIDGEVYIKKTSNESSKNDNDTKESSNNITTEITKISLNNLSCQLNSSDVPLVDNQQKADISYNDLCQLSTNVLPSYMPPPPSNSVLQLSDTDTSEEFNCVDCGDHFIMESSLSRHLERRSILVKFPCESCGKLLAYYNRCALLAHIRLHQEKEEPADIRKAIVLPLPRELMEGFTSPTLSLTAETNEVESVEKDIPKVEFNVTLDKHKCCECGILVDSAKSKENHFGGNISLPLQAAVCSKCNMTCPTKCSMQAHQRIHLHSRPYVCPECGEHFTDTWEKFQNHMKLKCFHFSRIIGYKCSVCSVLHNSTDTLQSHIVEAHSEAYYKCQACPMAFKATTTFDTHRKSAHPSSDIQYTIITKCPLCDTVFHSKGLLQTHLQAHIKDQLHNTIFVFKCAECNELLETKSSLFVHIQQVHPNLLTQRLCSQCGMAFPTSRALKEHMKDVHRARCGEFTTKCYVCHREFQTIHGYKIHRQRCHGTASLRCATCGETLADKFELVSHGMQHLKEGIHVCLVCNNEKYSDSNALLAHLQHHAKSAKYPNQCLQCQQTVNDVKEAFLHLKEEHKLTIFQCKQCDISYESSVRLARHQKVMHEEFGLKKRHVCWICKEYGFSKRAILKRHITTKHNIPEDEIDFSQAPRPPIKIRIPLIAVKRHYSSDDKIDSWDPLPIKRSSNRYNPKKELGYICAKCDFRSTDSVTFRDHIIIHKTEKASLQCTECGTCFIVEPSLRKHLMVVHKIQDTEAFIPKIDTVENVTDVNTFKCKVCHQIFDNNDQLQTHMRRHGMAFIQSTKSRTASIKSSVS